MNVSCNCHGFYLGIMGTKFIYLSLVVFGLAASPALAAEPIAQVTAVQGKVLLNQGDGFQTVEKMATIEVGDQLLVSKNASVSLDYAAADCASSFSDPSVITVGSSAPCANQPDAKKSRSSGGSGAAVSGAAQRGSSSFSVPSLGGGTSGTTTTLVPIPVSLP